MKQKRLALKTTPSKAKEAVLTQVQVANASVYLSDKAGDCDAMNTVDERDQHGSPTANHEAFTARLEDGNTCYRTPAARGETSPESTPNNSVDMKVETDDVKDRPSNLCTNKSINSDADFVNFLSGNTSSSAAANRAGLAPITSSESYQLSLLQDSNLTLSSVMSPANYSPSHLDGGDVRFAERTIFPATTSHQDASSLPFNGFYHLGTVDHSFSSSAPTVSRDNCIPTHLNGFSYACPY